MWGLVFSALGPGECFGLRGFGDKWCLRVLGLPLILGTAIALYHFRTKCRKDAHTAWLKTKTFSFLAVFFCCK